jgi:hypothetical protein
MSRPNLWAAIIVFSGGLCVVAAFVKYDNTPPPAVAPVAALPSATGDADAHDVRVWNDLTDVIDTERCDDKRLYQLAASTNWNVGGGIMIPAGEIARRRAAMAEFRQVTDDIVLSEQHRENQGEIVIEGLQADARSKAMHDFVDAEQGLVDNQISMNRLRDAMLDMFGKLLDVASSVQRSGRTTAADAAEWNRLVASLKNSQEAHRNDNYTMEAERNIRYTELNHLVGRRPQYSYSRPDYNDWDCSINDPNVIALDDIDRKAQQILAH